MAFSWKCKLYPEMMREVGPLVDEKRGHRLRRRCNSNEARIGKQGLPLKVWAWSSPRDSMIGRYAAESNICRKAGA